MRTALAINNSNTGKEMVLSETNRPRPFLTLCPKEMIETAAGIATILSDIILQQELYSVIRGNRYVHVEGWTTMGSLLGILPREKAVKRLKDGSYKATVELYNVNTSQVVGRASSICGMDEENWGDAEHFARRSMAITRATGKAYRLGFSWIMVLAGYKPTPFEEMPLNLQTETQAFKPTQAPLKPTQAPVVASSERVYLNFDGYKDPAAKKAAQALGAQYDANAQKFRWYVSSDNTEAINRWGFPDNDIQIEGIF